MMAKVTNIRSIQNSMLNPITLVNGENRSQIISVAAGGAWGGEIWVPWVGGPNEMYKAIEITLGNGKKIYIFQDYWDPPHADAVKYCYDNKYESGAELGGNNKGGGDKGVIIDHDDGIVLV